MATESTRWLGGALVCALWLLGAAAGAEPALETGLRLWSEGREAEAVARWRPLAQAGHPEANLFLAYAHRTGRGAPLDPQRAFRHYLAAARAGLPEAQFELALMYELGVGTDADPGEAARWYGLATGGEFCPSELPRGGRLGD